MKSQPTSQAILARRENPVELWRDPGWQRLWLAIQARPWRSLALLPAGEGGPADFALRVAVTLARTGMVHLGSPVQVADGTKIPLAYLTQFIEEVNRCTRDKDFIIIALAPLVKNPVALSIAQAADAVVLCVLLDCMLSSEAKKTVAQIGLNRFVGSVILHSNDEIATDAANGSDR